MKKLLIIQLFIFFSFCSSQSQGYKIKVEIKGAENQDIWLAYYYEDNYVTVSQIKLDNKGTGVFEGEKKLDGGIYFAALGDIGYFDFLIADDQEFTLSTDTLDFILNMKVKGSHENSVFYEYQRKVLTLSNSKAELESKKTLFSDSIEISKIDIDISLINNNLNSLWIETADKYPESFFAVLLKAMHTFEVAGNEDPFSYVDFSDDRLIRTPFFYNIIRYYIAIYIEEGSTKIIEENNKLLKKCINDTVYQYVATYLLNFYRTFLKLGINEVFVDLADNHFLNGNGYWIDSAAVEMISKQTEIFRASYIGHDAYDFKILSTSGDSIQALDFETNFRFILFWSIGCGHCEDAANTLKTNRDKIEALDIDILGVNTDGKNIDDWKKYIDEQGFTWKNGIDTSQYYRFREYYYVCSTPLMYVIDRNHKIVNKMFGEDQIKDYIEFITK
jgi:peroxiredoxin